MGDTARRSRGAAGASTLGTDEVDRLRGSGLIASQLIGFAMFRYIWKIEPVASIAEEDIVAAIAPNIQRYVDADLLTSAGATPR